MPDLNIEEAKGRMRDLAHRYGQQSHMRRSAEELAEAFTPATSLHQVMKACAGAERELQGKFLAAKTNLARVLNPPAPEHPCPDHGGGEICLNLDNPALKCAPGLCPVELEVTQAGALALAGR